MKVVVTGVGGQLGTEVLDQLIQRGHQAIGLTLQDLDITREEDVNEVFHHIQPDAVIHCAAYTAVDLAQEEQEAAYQVNVLGTRYLAKACATCHAKFLYVSTEYVFSGAGEKPWTVNDVVDPQNIYGKTKAAGEAEVVQAISQYFIVRTSWVVGIHGKNFVKTMLNLGKKNDQVRVVTDQIGSPTFTFDLAKLLIDMVETNRYGYYHASNEGYCSWYEFALEIFRQAKIDVTVNPVESSEFPTKAVRPKNSRMDKSCLDQNGFQRLPDWRESLNRYLLLSGEII